MTAPRWWQHLGWPVAVVLLSVGGMYLGGVPTWRSLVIALAAGVAVWALAITADVPRVRWHRDPPVRPYRHVTAWKVDGLADSPEAFDSRLRPRLWGLACELMQRRGIDPLSEGARGILGARLYDVLTGADTDPRHIRDSIPALCQAVARLAVDGALPGNSPISDPRLAGLAGRRRGRGPSPQSSAAHARDR